MQPRVFCWYPWLQNIPSGVAGPMHLQLLIHLVKNPNDSEESKTEQTHRKVELITIDQFSYLRTIYQKVYNFCILATIL